MRTKLFWKWLPLPIILCICTLFLITTQLYIASAITPTPLPTLPPLNLTPSGEYIALADPLPKVSLSPRRITATNIDHLTEIRRIGDDSPNALQVVVFTQDNMRLISNTHELLVWSVPQFQVLERIAVQPWQGWNAAPVGPFAVHPNGHILASANMVERGWVELWDVTTGQRLRQHRGGEIVKGIDFNQSGKSLVASRDGGYVDIWNVVDGSLQAEIHSPRMCSSAVNVVQNTIVVFNDDKSLVTYDLDNGSLLSTVTVDSTDLTDSLGCSVTGMRFSPDGKILAMWQFWKKRVTLWKDGALIAALAFPGEPGEGDTILNATWSPDNSLLVVATNGGKTGGAIVFWDVTKNKVVHILDDTKSYGRPPLAFSPDGAWLVMDHLSGSGHPFLEGLSVFAVQP